jgi:hypothetical protein
MVPPAGNTSSTRIKNAFLAVPHHERFLELGFGITRTIAEQPT